jgi:CheY-like chemotaxis protein
LGINRPKGFAALAMINSENRLCRQLAPLLQRVLLVDASLAGTRTTAEVLKDLGASRIYPATNEAQALAICREAEPQLVITEMTGPTLDGLRFVRALRRSDLSCRSAPVIVASADATAAAIVGARNAGVHEFLRKPFTIRDLTRRLDAAMLRPREWIEAVNYVGPDRRRFNSGDYQGPRKRMADSAKEDKAARILQALKILASAVAAIETDPVQSLRAMQAQAASLRTVAVAAGDLKLIEAVARLQRPLMAAATSGVLPRPEIEAGCADLWTFMPSEPKDSSRPTFELA